MIYFIQAGENGPIKIGRSKTPEYRLYAMQSYHWESLKLLAIKEYQESDGEAEKILHAIFKRHHISGEWFKPEAILRYLKNWSLTFLRVESFLSGVSF